MLEETKLEKLLEDIEASLSESKIDMMADALAILRNDDKFDMVVDRLKEGLTEAQALNFDTLARNTRDEFLLESATSADLNAFAPLQLTLIRSVLPRYVMTNLVTHKVLTSPSEQFGYLRAYLRDAAGTLTDISKIHESSQFAKTPIVKTAQAVPAIGVDLFAGITATPTTLDRDFHITNITMSVLDSGDANAETITVTEKFRQGTDGGNIAITVSGTHTDGTVTTGSLYGSVDRKTGELNLISTSTAIKTFDFVGKVSPEYNNASTWEIEHVYKKDTIEVGEGDVINSPLPYSYIKDLEALFKLDAMGQAVKTISQSFAAIDDIRMMEDIYGEVDGVTERTVTWSATKPDGVTKIDHNLDLVERVNRAIAVSDEATQFTGNTRFNILANPLDSALLSSSRINSAQYTGSVSKGGSLNNFNQFEVNSTNGDIGVFSTKLAKRGEMLIIPISNIDEEVVYAKYDYSNILFTNNEIRSAKAPLVKNIAAIQRNAYKKFRTDSIVKIIIEDNV